MTSEAEAVQGVSPSIETAVDQIEEWAAVLAIQLGVSGAAKLLRRLADEVEALPAQRIQ